MIHSVMKVAAVVILFTAGASASGNGEEARWLVQESLWGTLSWLEDETASAMVTSYGESDGRIFCYLPINIPEFKAAITLSEAALNTTQFEGAKCGPNGNLDPEDPRCAKLTISGNMKPVEEDTKQFGLDTLYAKHPQMENWPADHGFIVYEMHIDSLWMIANYGGGGYFTAEDFLESQPQHHAAEGFHPKRRITEVSTTRPDFGNDAAGHARWLVAKSLWTTITTISSKDEGQAFGNIRSVVDGGCFLDGSGYPVFYLPTPDPSAADLGADEKNNLVLSFTEAALPQLVGEDGKACGGNDAEDPTCAKISITGHAVAVTDAALLEKVKTSFGVQHPMASWLSAGGAHTGGQFYSIHIHSFEFFRNYGGLAELSVEDYTNWVPDPSKYSGEEQCDTSVSTSVSTMEGHTHGGDHAEDGPGGCYPGPPTHACGCAADSCSKELCEAKGHTWTDACPHCDPQDCKPQMEVSSNAHAGDNHYHAPDTESSVAHNHDMDAESSFGSSAEYHHGMDGEHSRHHEHSETDASIFSIRSFIYGTVFGFLLWGPTVALIVYHKSCGAGRNSRSQKYEPAPATIC